MKQLQASHSSIDITNVDHRKLGKERKARESAACNLLETIWVPTKKEGNKERSPPFPVGGDNGCHK